MRNIFDIQTEAGHDTTLGLFDTFKVVGVNVGMRLISGGTNGTTCDERPVRTYHSRTGILKFELYPVAPFWCS